MQLNRLISNLKMICFLFALTCASATVKAQYVINDVFADLSECDTMTRGIFIVWWDSDFNYSAQADVLLDSMISYQNTCLNSLSMEDPPNPTDGYFYNVYIHVPGDADDIFLPNGWANGQGTDFNGYPFLTLPGGILSDFSNTAHETFHVFQYSANAPGFEYYGDSQWYIEGSANWFAARENPDIARAFVEAESLVRMPHVPLWLSYSNFPSTYPENWQRYVHQYAMALFLYYLTDVEGVSEDLITSGLYSFTLEKPQEYMSNIIGKDLFRQYFIDWAAHMSNDFDFIPQFQADANLNEWMTYADLADDNEFIEIFENEGTTGWFTPDDARTTNAWSFNTYKLLNTNSETYTFELNAEPMGTYGDSAYFQGKLLVQNSVSGASFYDLDMTDNVQGSLSLSLTPQDTAIYYIVASTPQVFVDANPSFQRFPYEMRITLGALTGITEMGSNIIKEEVARFNLLGQQVKKGDGGVQVILYNDGTTEKRHAEIRD
ncbi:MAG: hypothetical protein ACI9P5_004833 [Saprospiraceae bacterium]|jgi:hypothetical protein